MSLAIARVSATPDHDLFQDLARVYSDNHLTMKTKKCGFDNFANGITNGAAWYVVAGGMQDYNYLYTNCFEITVEMSCCKFVQEPVLNEKWNENKDSMVRFLNEVHKGVKGHVKDENDNLVSGAEIVVENVK